MSEIVKWRLYFAYSFTLGVVALAITGPFLVANGWLKPNPLRLIVRAAKVHADRAYPRCAL